MEETVRWGETDSYMVATIDLGILVVFLIVFLFAAGIVHPIFWLLCAFVSMLSTSVFNDLYPDTLWSFVFLIFGIMLIVVTWQRISDPDGFRVRL